MVFSFYVIEMSRVFAKAQTPATGSGTGASHPVTLTSFMRPELQLEIYSHVTPFPRVLSLRNKIRFKLSELEPHW